jgi:hypothetical protein
MNTTAEGLAALKARFGARWADLVRAARLDGSMTWCARRWDADYSHNLHAHTSAELTEYLTEAETEH